MNIYWMAQMVQENKNLKRHSQLLISQVSSIGQVNLVSILFYSLWTECAMFIILSLKELRRDQISSGVLHTVIFIYLFISEDGVWRKWRHWLLGTNL